MVLWSGDAESGSETLHSKKKKHVKKQQEVSDLNRD